MNADILIDKFAKPNVLVPSQRRRWGDLFSAGGGPVCSIPSAATALCGTRRVQHAPGKLRATFQSDLRGGSLRAARPRGPVLVLIAGISLLQVLYLIAGILRFYYRGDSRRVWPKVISVGSALFLYPLNSAFLTLAQTAAAAIALARL